MDSRALYIVAGLMVLTIIAKVVGKFFKLCLGILVVAVVVGMLTSCSFSIELGNGSDSAISQEVEVCV